MEFVKEREVVCSLFQSIFQHEQYYLILVEDYLEDKAPQEAIFYVWTTSLGNILTLDNLQRCRITTVDCVICAKRAGRLDHILLRCETATTLIKLLFTNKKLFLTTLGQSGYENVFNHLAQGETRRVAQTSSWSFSFMLQYLCYFIKHIRLE